MARGDLPALAGLEIADPAELWSRFGFTVSGAGICTVGGVEISLRGPEAGAGIVGWALRAAGELPASVDGIATTTAPRRPPAAEAAHPNGAVAVDHVVVHTPDLRRTLGALQAVGMEVRRVREGGPDLRQAFLWAGDVLVEVAGPPTATGDEPARLWGLVIVAPDLEQIAALPGQPLGSVRDAVQPGRRIATVRRELGSSVPLAFMTPHQPAGRTVESE